MKNHVWIFVLAILVLAGLLVYTVAFQVDYTQGAVVTRFGQVTRVLPGRQSSGLHFKWPWPVERVTTYDSRTHVFEGTASQIQTSDGQTVVVSMFVAWRIGESPEQMQAFQKQFASLDAARNRIETMLVTYQKEVIASRSMGNLINTDKDQMQMDVVEDEVHKRLSSQVADAYGVKIERVGIRNLVLPETVSKAVIEAMKAERERFAQRYQAAGEAQAIAIRERARAAADEILAFAQRRAQNIRTEGDAAAAEYYSKFQQSPELSMFLRSIESLRRELKSRTVILLDGSQVPGIRMFSNGPEIPAAPQTVSGAPAAAAAPSVSQ